MTKHVTKLAGLTAALLALTAPASAEIKINENFSVSGYLSGSYQYMSPDPGASTDRFDMDPSLLLFTAAFKPVTGVVSLYYNPGAARETTVLDAYATYDAGGGVSITGGKFLSYLGYESFFTSNNPTISFANGDFLGAIPGYHTGVRLDYSSAAWSSGFAVVDSVYSGPFYLKGDGELKQNAGFEAFFKYTGTPDLTLWFGAAYDTQGNKFIGQTHSVLTLNVWAQYQIDKKTMVAAEYANKDGGVGNKGYNWLVLGTYAFTDKVSSAFRVSGEKLDNGGPEFTKFTIAPAYAVTDKLTVRIEASYYDYNRAFADSATFFGVQAFFKF